jgi:AraC-like DNA-binding protein
MFIVLGGFSIKWILDMWFIAETTVFGAGGHIPLTLSRIALFAFINALIFKSLKQPEYFTGIVHVRSNSDKKSLSISSEKKYKEILTNYMESHKPYMNPEITLSELANEVSIPPRSLSEIINNSFGQNFFDFINSYRIKESKQLLLNEDSSQKKTILEILYEVGFNSKSSFNNAFKKNTGMTPTQYKQSVRAIA